MLRCAFCLKETVYTVAKDAVRFTPFKLLEADLDANATQTSLRLFPEAMRCFYSKANSASVALCRAIVESELDSKGGQAKI